MAYGWMLLFAGGYRERIYGVCMICSSLCLFISFHFLCLDPLVGDGGFVAFFYIHPLEPLWRGWVPCGYFHFFSGFFLFRLPLVVRLHCLDGETSYFFVIIKKGTREFYAPNSSSSRIISGFFMTRSGFYFFLFLWVSISHFMAVPAANLASRLGFGAGEREVFYLECCTAHVFSSVHVLCYATSEWRGIREENSSNKRFCYRVLRRCSRDDI